jgi:predicted small lipoprotein YifL
MKRITAFMIVFAMTLSLAACGAPAETAQTDTAQTAQATETPTEEPTPTPEPEPTPTPEPEPTEAEKMCILWLESAKERRHDVYANLVTKDAYDNGELDDYIADEEDKERLNNYNHLIKTSYYPVSDNILTDDYNVEELTEADLTIALLRGDSFRATDDHLEDAIRALSWYLSEEYSLVSALPEDKREDVYDLIDIINDSVEVKKDVTGLEETIDSYDLDWRQKWYVVEYCTSWRGISPTVKCNGEEMQFGEYIGNMASYILEVQDILSEQYLLDGCDDVQIFPELE